MLIFTAYIVGAKNKHGNFTLYSQTSPYQVPRNKTFTSDNFTYRTSSDIFGHMNQLVPSAVVLPVEIADRLDAWAVEARAAFSENTQRAYAADSRAYAAWCAAQRIVALPAQPTHVAAYLRSEIEAGKSVATVRRRAATISRMHMAAELPNPCASELVKLALKGIARAKGTDQRQAAPVTERDAFRIRAHLGDSAKDLRDLALLLVGRDVLARSSELVSLQAGDVEFTDAGAVLKLRRRKTSTDSQACYIGHEATEALRNWMTRVGIAEGPVFRSLTRGGRPTDLALDTRDVRRIFKGLASRAKLAHAPGVSGHSVRVGMSQDLIAADVDMAAVMQAGGWSTPRMVARYTARVAATRGAVARYYSKRA